MDVEAVEREEAGQRRRLQVQGGQGRELPQRGTSSVNTSPKMIDSIKHTVTHALDLVAELRLAQQLREEDGVHGGEAPEAAGHLATTAGHSWSQ